MSSSDQASKRLRRPRTRTLIGAAAALVFGALVAYDELVTHETERAAESMAGLIGASVAGDGERACELMTPESREATAAVARMMLEEPGAGCEEAVVSGAQRSQALGGPTEVDDLDPGAMAADVSIEDDRATLRAEGELVTLQMEAVDIDGEWRVDLGGTRSEPVSDASAGRDPADVRQAADQICLVSFEHGTRAIALMQEAALDFDEAGAERHAASWRENERRLIADLGSLADQHELDDLEPLIDALGEQEQAVTSFTRAILDPRSTELELRFAEGRIMASAREVSEVAERAGLTHFGCAVPPGPL